MRCDVKTYFLKEGSAKFSLSAFTTCWSTRSISTELCPFSFTAFMFASDSNVSSFAMNLPRTSLRRSKLIFRAGPTDASCITLILRKKRCCGLLCNSSVARCISTLVIATNEVALPDEICIPRNLYASCRLSR